MRILYDYQGFLQKSGGVSRCFCEYINEIKKNNKVIISCPLTDNIYLKDILNIKESSLLKIPFIRNDRRLIEIIDKVNSIIEIEKNKFDIFHPTFDSSFYYGKILKRPYVLTIHDLIPEFFLKDKANKNINYWLKNKALAIKNASRIMCVSENTKKDLLEFYNYDTQKIDVVPHGIYPYTGKYANNNNGNYILFVGNRASYKNFKFTIKALIPLFKRYKDINILCTGSKFTPDENQFICDLNLTNRIKSVGYLNDAQLATLYHHALLFIYPSIYEGFGIPILEAFVNKCPACISNTSSFPEVGGNAVSYFDPHNQESILEAVTKVVENKSYADELREKGYIRAQNYTWKSASEQVINCYKKALK